MTSQTETVDATKILAYMDENYNIPSHKGDETEPFAALERKKPDVRVNPYSVDRPTKRRMSPTMKKPTA